MPTTLQQRQIAKSSQPDDTLAFPDYNSLETLEEDLNYLRSIIKQIKGTANYDSPLLTTLLDLEAALAAASFHDAELTGEPTAPTPPEGNISTRIATTEYVTTTVNAAVFAGGGDARYVHNQGIPASTWTVNHNLAKYPSVSVVDSAQEQVFGKVQYIDNNNLTVSFSASFSGQAYIN